MRRGLPRGLLVVRGLTCPPLTPAQKQARRRAKLAEAGQVDRTLVVPVALTVQAAEIAAALCAWDAGYPPAISDDTALLVAAILRSRPGPAIG